MRSLVNQPRSPPSPAGSFDNSVATLAKSSPALTRASAALASSSVGSRMWRHVDFQLRRLLLGGGVVGLALGLLGRGRFRGAGQQPLHRQLVVVVSQPAREVGAAVELVRQRLLGDELEIDEIIEHVFLPLGTLHLLGKAGADVDQRVVEVVLGNRDAVDLGEHFRVGPGRRRDGGEQAERPERQGKSGRAGSRRLGWEDSHGNSYCRLRLRGLSSSAARIMAILRTCEGESAKKRPALAPRWLSAFAANDFRKSAAGLKTPSGSSDQRLSRTGLAGRNGAIPRRANSSARSFIGSPA